MKEKLMLSSLITHFSYKPYERPFETPISFGSGSWQVRRGWILRIENAAGRIGYGEVAPLPPAWGGENMEAIANCLKRLEHNTSLERLLPQVKGLPSLQAGISMAELDSEGFFEGGLPNAIEIAAFLPTRLDSILVLKTQLETGFRSFKIKISGLTKERVRRLLDPLWEHLPTGVRLRLDAIQSFDRGTFEKLLPYFEKKPIEFIEEPFKTPSLEALAQLAQACPVPLALDEQCGTLDALRKAQVANWKGVYVVKPSGIGDLRLFESERKQMKGTFVYSTAFETAIGARTLLHIAARDESPRAIGIGALHALKKDGLGFQEKLGPCLPKGWGKNLSMEALWNAL